MRLLTKVRNDVTCSIEEVFYGWRKPKEECLLFLALLLSGGYSETLSVAFKKISYWVLHKVKKLMVALMAMSLDLKWFKGGHQFMIKKKKKHFCLN